jgi:regulator of protease activity HflC (stomatin/prohibitin superfamily)
MSPLQATVFAVITLAIVVLTARAARIVQQHEHGVVFRLGRLRKDTRSPGLTWIVPIVDRLVNVNLQINTMNVPAQDGITRDNVPVRVDAVVYFRVIDPVKALVNVDKYIDAVSQVTQTALRAAIGRTDLDELLSGWDKLNGELTDAIDALTERPWGVRIERAELKDVAVSESMKSFRSRQVEAERGRRAEPAQPMSNTNPPPNSQPPPWPPTSPYRNDYCGPSSKWPPKRTAPW